MNNLEYLNHISQSNRPTPQSKKAMAGFGIIWKVLIGGLVATALLIGIGVLINNGSSRATDLTIQLSARTTAVNKVISDYNKSLKSSQLRSINYSLSGTLTGVSSQLSHYISETYAKDSPATMKEETTLYESQLIGSTNGALSNAKINGTLDRAYYTQISLQVSLMMSLVEELMARDKDPALHEILEPFYSNLDAINKALADYNQ